MHFVAKPNSGASALSTYNSNISTGKSVKVWTVTIGAGQSKLIPTEVLLGGMSCGTISKRIYVES